MCRHRRHRRLNDIVRSLNNLHRKVNQIMATQEQLDALVTRIDTAVAGIRADIEVIKGQHPDIDLSGLEARVAGLEGLDAENPEAPVEPGE